MHKIYILLFVLLLTTGEIIAQVDNSTIIKEMAVKASADSSNIAVNRKDNWLFLNSYLSSVSTDSVRLEMVLQHDSGLNLMSENAVAQIKSIHFRPSEKRILSFESMNAIYQLRIDPTGECFIRLSQGSLPINDPVIVTVKTVYKR